MTSADERKLVGVDNRLVSVVRELAARSPTPFMVTEGLRSAQRQRQLYGERKTKTLFSKHLTGKAVDIVPLVEGQPKWEWEHYHALIACAKEVCADLGIGVTFGYDWGWDAPHMELK